MENRYFYDPEEFEFLQALVDGWRDIYQEFLAIEEHHVHPWPEKNLYQTKGTANDEELVEPGTGWDVFGLYAFGKKRPESCEMCPITTEIIESFSCGPPKTAAFSRLVPNAHILPHSGYKGYSSKVLRCHLGLEVPEDSFGPSSSHPLPYEHPNTTKFSGCSLRVGEQYCSWKQGELMVFDDSFIHEAWNYCSTRRVVLLLDFDRPAHYLVDEEDDEESEEEVDEFENGNRGTVYLDQLTTEFGYGKGHDGD